MGFVGQMLSDYVGPTALRKFDVRFKGMTRLDDIITCTGTITEKYEADGEARIAGRVHAADQNDEVKVAGRFERRYHIVLRKSVETIYGYH